MGSWVHTNLDRTEMRALASRRVTSRKTKDEGRFIWLWKAPGCSSACLEMHIARKMCRRLDSFLRQHQRRLGVVAALRPSTGATQTTVPLLLSLVLKLTPVIHPCTFTKATAPPILRFDTAALIKGQATRALLTGACQICPSSRAALSHCQCHTRAYAACVDGARGGRGSVAHEPPRVDGAAYMHACRPLRAIWSPQGVKSSQFLRCNLVRFNFFR
jgi:hypothetical protein